MTKTNWSRFSSLLLALLVLLSVAAPVAALSVGNADVPEETAVGSQVEATFTLTELYQNPTLEQWQLRGETELRDVTWSLSYVDQTGATVGREEFDGQNFSSSQISASDGTAEVRIRVTGTAPPVESYSYDPEQTFVVASLTQAREGGNTNALDTWEAHHFTSGSDRARNALDDAQAAIDAARENGANPGEAENTFNQAVNAYESENFDLATELANEAQSQAQSAQQSQQTFTLVLYAVAGLVVVALLVGGFLYWRSQQDSHDPLG
ncbi:hypothetical protein C2R22_17240 [Salinigranum rubrum]|uniref:Uncharacterized protein n=1 Tax=Salinigranum rubrum TaxID=755307 RepID=A0A2I8VMQ7_9EURY|nr:hypothetical protein [Salinigranum rubrum]AUV83175.1 hypothetical protein C2R22_17240 [Salinigranum rubrum]